MNSRRVLRAAEAIREVVSTAILLELTDPRIENVTVTYVEVAGDMHVAGSRVVLVLRGRTVALQHRQRQRQRQRQRRPQHRPHSRFMLVALACGLPSLSLKSHCHEHTMHACSFVDVVMDALALRIVPHPHL